MTVPLLDQGAASIAAAVREARVAAVEVFGAAHGRLLESHAGPDGIHAVLSTAEPPTVAPTSGPLAGVPVAIKDNIATLTLPTSCGSRILEHWVSPYEATAARKLREAGASLIGKTNMDEFAMGSSTENSAYGPSRNPHDRTRAPGGSSGGSAAAVAAGIAPIALGSETGGSVRQPAAFCGVVGVKPTYGRVSRFGLVAFASSLDGIGVFGRTVDDAALATEIVSGHDPHDATSAAVEPAAMRIGPGTLDGLVIGVPREYFPDSLDPSVRERCDRAREALRAQGATLRDVSLPHTDLAIPVYYIIAPAECSANLARFDGVRYGMRIEGDGIRAMYEATRAAGFGAEVTRRILLGTYVLSAGYYDAYYRKAQQVRELIRSDFDAVFASGVQALFTPTTPTPAFALGAISDPYEMYLSDIFTVTANLAGVPAMSVPIGRVGGLPVGGQILARHFDETTMFRVAYALEEALGAEAAR
ncbi:MAG: Asp-tRNA(Asn)/Glu-tRNA(Gln) amidotransferase subunit GatA [Gemmatimonadaceae bacterium]